MRRDRNRRTARAGSATMMTIKPDDRAVIGAEIRPELAQRMRRRSAIRRRSGRIEDVGGHRVCRMRGLISAVGDVDQQVDRHDDRADQQRAALQHRIVAPADASISHLPTPGQEKIVSVRIAPVNSTPTCRPITVTTGNQRVAQAHGCAMTRKARQALGARGADVVLAQHFEHRRARHARDHGERHGAEHDGRQDEMRQRRAERALIAREQACRSAESR